MNLQPVTCLILTDNPSEVVQHAISLEGYGWKVTIKKTDHPIELNNNNLFELVIVDLDGLLVRDCEGFKEYIANCGNRVYVLCGTSFQRLAYYKEFEVFSGWDNLFERVFFQ